MAAALPIMAAVPTNSYGYYEAVRRPITATADTMEAGMVTAISGVPHYRGHPLAGW